MRQNYAGTFDFAQFDEKGVEPITKAFAKAGLEVIEVVATNKAARRAGFQVKQATFYFADEQRIVMMLKNDGKGGGDIYQVTLNSRVIPVKNVGDMDKAVAEIAAMASSNSAAFSKAARRRAERQSVDESDLEGNKPKKAVTAAAKLEAAKAEAETLAADVTAQETRQAELTAQIEAAKAQHESDLAELNRLMEENEQLEAEAA